MSAGPSKWPVVRDLGELFGNRVAPVFLAVAEGQARPPRVLS